MEKKYLSFDKFVYRTPLYDLNRYNDDTTFFDKTFNESLFIASPEFYGEKIKVLKDEKISEKMKLSFMKYLSRASTRCTPFGLFAGCSVGSIGDTTNIVLSDICDYKRVTRLDMNYMCALIQEIEKQKDIRSQLNYYPNDSIYMLGGAYRYVEYFYSGVRRVHKISSVDVSDYLTQILDAASIGKHCDELANLLIDDEVTYDEAFEFIEELIDAQILKSELEITVTGNNSLDRLIGQLRNLSDTDELIGILTEINDLLESIDSSHLGESIEIYDKLIDKIKTLHIKFDPKFLFQTDMFKPSEATISKDVSDDMNSLFTFMNKVTSKPSQTNLSTFRKAFLERYDELEIPLLEVLDTELGIGYLQNGVSDVPNELIAGVAYRVGMQGGGSNGSGEGSRLQNIMLKKYVECIKNNDHSILLTDDDVSSYEADWTDIPNTVSVLCSLMGDGTIYIKSVGGSSAANLLGRFCHLNTDIETLVKDIAQKDQELTPDAILAEIVHLPESRIGNILFRPILRDYEIHYLAKSELTADYSISLSDLYLSVRGNRIIMRSKRLNKEIIPRLTTAHNYSYNALPIYQFLCEMQTQNLRGGFYVGWDSVFGAFEYKPRLMYKNFILSREQWYIDGDKIKDINGRNLKKYIHSLAIPRYVLIPDGDNEQFIDFENEGLVELFISILKKRKKLWIEEFLFDTNDEIVKDNQGNVFCNEFLFSYFKNI